MACSRDLFFITVIFFFTHIEHDSRLCTGCRFFYAGNIFMGMGFLNCYPDCIGFTLVSILIPCIDLCVIDSHLVLKVTGFYTVYIFSILQLSPDCLWCHPAPIFFIRVLIPKPCRKLHTVYAGTFLSDFTAHGITAFGNIRDLYIWDHWSGFIFRYGHCSRRTIQHTVRTRASCIDPVCFNLHFPP